MMALGAQGTMNAVANVAPRQVAALCNAVRVGRVGARYGNCTSSCST